MRRITSFLKAVFTANDCDCLPAPNCEMTLHDALRLCTRRVRIEEGSTSTQTLPDKRENAIQVKRQMAPELWEAKPSLEMFKRRVF